MVAKINKLYRAFTDYRKVTATDSDLKRERKNYKLIDKESQDDLDGLIEDRKTRKTKKEK